MTEGDNVLRKQAWDYFTIVAAQRLTVINFYIAAGTLLAGGQFALLQNLRYAKASMVLGCLLMMLSFVFWRWDRRSSDLIKFSEGILRYYEGRLETDDPTPNREFGLLFTREEKLTAERKSTARWFRPYFTYRSCLNLLYLMFATIGAIGSILALRAT